MDSINLCLDKKKFSRSGFTEPAKTLARFIAPQTILLWKGDEIEYALHQHHMCQGLIAKYRHCIEQSIPSYDIIKESL